MSHTRYLSLVRDIPTLKEAGLRVVKGLRNDIGMTDEQIALIIPDPDQVTAAARDLDILVWVDGSDAQRRGVFVMKRDRGGWAGPGFYVVFGFGPSVRRLDYIEDVVDDFIAAGRGGMSLFYPTGNPLGAFGAGVLGSEQVSSSGIRRETADSAKQKIIAYRAAHGL